MLRFLGLASILVIAACATVEPLEQRGLPPIALTPGMAAAAKQAVAAKLKDPYSAQYEGLTAFRKSEHDLAVCGLVNAKNSYGGYVGMVPFIAYVAEGVNQKAGQYFPIVATLSDAEDADGHIFYQIVPLCAP